MPGVSASDERASLGSPFSRVAAWALLATAMLLLGGTVFLLVGDSTLGIALGLLVVVAAALVLVLFDFR